MEMLGYIGWILLGAIVLGAALSVLLEDKHPPIA